MRLLVVSALILVVVCVDTTSPPHSTSYQLISQWGYPAERHFATCPDGYILQMFRVANPGKPVAFLQHGFIDSSDTWLMNPPDESLAFLLYDAGFDVWLGNLRGNRYSMNHTRLNPHEAKFWEFSWDEMAKYDLPTMLKWVTEYTNKQNVSYVGHSQGNTIAFANYAGWKTAPAYMNFHAGLVPVVFAGHMQSDLIRWAADLHIDKLIGFDANSEFDLDPRFMRKWFGALCEDHPGLCDNVVKLFSGYNPADFNNTRWSFYMEHFPNPTSMKTFIHWAQAVRDKDFQMYDFGFIGNERHYGRLHPPKYDLSTMRHPELGIFYGGKDVLADPTDVNHLLEFIDNSTIAKLQEFPSWGHLDFVWGRDAHTDLYRHLIPIMKKYSMI